MELNDIVFCKSKVLHLCCRELHEECGAEVNDLERIGLLMFEFKDQEQLLEVHVYQTDAFSGTIVETDGVPFHVLLLVCDGVIKLLILQIGNSLMHSKLLVFNISL